MEGSPQGVHALPEAGGHEGHHSPVCPHRSLPSLPLFPPTFPSPRVHADHPHPAGAWKPAWPGPSSCTRREGSCPNPSSLMARRGSQGRAKLAHSQGGLADAKPARGRRRGGRFGSRGHSQVLTLRSTGSHGSLVYFWSCRQAVIADRQGAAREVQRRAPTWTSQNALGILPSILTPGCLYKALDSFPKGAASRREANSWGTQAAVPTQLMGTSTSQGSAFSKGRETHPIAGKGEDWSFHALDYGSWQGFSQSQPKLLSEMSPTNT